jgi:transposase InsO family protein
MRYRLIDAWKKKARVTQICRVLDVSRSGYYARQGRLEKASICTTTVHLKAAFVGSGKSYGSRRLVDALHKKGIQIGRYKVRRLMREAHLKPVWRKRFVNTTDSKHDLPIAENILNRQFNPSAPNRAWSSDITYVRTQSGWLYLAAVMDLFSRKVIGWATDSTMPSGLVCRALQMAISARQPLPGLIVHSDRGSQYASEKYQQLLKKHGFICSMSRQGNCWDNAVMDRFFLNLKMERVWQRDYANHLEATQDITQYIVEFYNASRLHSTLGNLPPIIYEEIFATKQPVKVSEFT